MPKTIRILEIELMKAIAIIGMVYIHIFEMSLFIDEITSGTEFKIGVVLDFFGGIISGGAFMFAMGWGAAFSKGATPKSYVKRFFQLELYGILVNLFQQWLPKLIDPESYGSLSEGWYSIIAVDVYAFAGVCMLYFAVMKKLESNKPAKLIISLLLLVICLTVNSLIPAESFSTGFDWLDTLIGLFIRENEYSYFPLVSWIAFPIAGYGAGKLFQTWKDLKKCYILLGVIGTVALVGGSVIMKVMGIPNAVIDPFNVTDLEYYALSTINVITGVGLIAVELVLASLLLKLTKGKLPNFVTDLSRNVMHIYIAQWLIIGLLSGLIAKTVHLIPIALLALGVLAISFLYAKAREKKIATKIIQKRFPNTK